METPIEIHNNTSIELTRIVKKNSEYFFNKKYFYLADIFSIEASRYSIENLKCTKITFEDGATNIVNESYKSVRDTYKAYQLYVQNLEKNEH